MIKCVCYVCCITHVAQEILTLLPDLDLGKKYRSVFFKLSFFFFFFYFCEKISSNWEKSTQVSLCFQIKLYQHIIINANNQMIFLLQGRAFVSDELMSVILHMWLFDTPFVSDPIVDLGSGLL